jgi:hypothetical protein
MEHDRGTEETWSDWDGGNRNMAIGGIAAAAITAGLVAFLVRRRRAADEHTLTGMTSRAAEAAMSAVGDDRVSAGRDFLAEKILPEFKPALLSILDELEELVNQTFRRAERSIKDL